MLSSKTAIVGVYTVCLVSRSSAVRGNEKESTIRAYSRRLYISYQNTSDRSRWRLRRYLQTKPGSHRRRCFRRGYETYAYRIVGMCCMRIYDLSTEYTRMSSTMITFLVLSPKSATTAATPTTTNGTYQSGQHQNPEELHSALVYSGVHDRLVGKVRPQVGEHGRDAC